MSSVEKTKPIARLRPGVLSEAEGSIVKGVAQNKANLYGGYIGVSPYCRETYENAARFRGRKTNPIFSPAVGRAPPYFQPGSETVAW
jgi:hypothetical protein